MSKEQIQSVVSNKEILRHLEEDVVLYDECIISPMELLRQYVDEDTAEYLRDYLSTESTPTVEAKSLEEIKKDYYKKFDCLYMENNKDNSGYYNVWEDVEEYILESCQQYAQQIVKNKDNYIEKLQSMLHEEGVQLEWKEHFEEFNKQTQ